MPFTTSTAALHQVTLRAIPDWNSFPDASDGGNTGNRRPSNTRREPVAPQNLAVWVWTRLLEAISVLIIVFPIVHYSALLLAENSAGPSGDGGKDHLDHLSVDPRTTVKNFIPLGIHLAN